MSIVDFRSEEWTYERRASEEDAALFRDDHVLVSHGRDVCTTWRNIPCQWRKVLSSTWRVEGVHKRLAYLPQISHVRRQLEGYLAQTFGPV